MVKRNKKSHNTDHLKLKNQRNCDQTWAKPTTARCKKITTASRFRRCNLKSYNGQAVKSLTLICKSWKTHPDIFLKFSFSGASHRPFYWKTRPDNFSKFQFWFFITQDFLMDEFSSKTASEMSQKFADKG